MLPRTRYRIAKKKRLPWALFLLTVALLTIGLLHGGLVVKKAPSVHEKSDTPKTTLLDPATVQLPLESAATALPFPIGEDSGVLWNLSTGQLIWAYHPYLKGPYASTTKLMTIYLIINHLPLSQVVTISPLAAGTSGSDIRMAVGEHFTVRQLLYALMLASANDAAVALAQQEAGTVPAFLAQMRKTAIDLGMTDTTYADPDGLSPRSAGSAWDLAIIARADMESPLFRRIVRTKEISLPNNPVVRNLNNLLFLDPSVIGVKTGWTTEAGFNLVFAATRSVNGHKVTLLGVIMHGQDGFPPEDEDAEKILNWGFHRVATTKATTPP